MVVFAKTLHKGVSKGGPGEHESAKGGGHNVNYAIVPSVTNKQPSCTVQVNDIGHLILSRPCAAQPITGAGIMVGVQLQKPASNHVGSEQMTKVKDTLQTHFGINCKITKDDMSSIKLQLRWEGSKGSLFTLTLTPNTGYIQIQGPSDKTLTLAGHIQDLVGGVVYAARRGGAAPCNPNEGEPNVGATNEGANAHGASTEATDHGATNQGANHDGANNHGASTEATDHGATDDGATDDGANHHGEASDHAATNDSATEQAAAGTGTSSSSTGVGVSPITGNGNVQVGTVVINTLMEDSQGNATSQNVMNTLIHGLRNLFRES